MDAEATWDEAYLLAARDELVSHPEFSAALQKLTRDHRARTQALVTLFVTLGL